MQRIQRPSSFGGSLTFYLSAKRRMGIWFSHGDYWLMVTDFLKSFRECGYGLAGNLGRGIGA